ncbi:hypothetical protein A5707_17885 [Mycobacterium kyorinense]|uniref:DUF2784 domain-containing protein n=1 Tax=Mycobacterium kyorinense TaxID=487514 RepID=A0A1A2ZGR5_9MYCO|nr:DUF2784 domain-containing protein [Mycobacterium kyorinense]OBI48276.1 hypothetical protein A5707_17885 [Mycobacterium kyorinense]
MKRLHFAFVVGTVSAHFTYLIYLPSGGFLALRWPRTLWLHIPAVVWGVGVVTLNLPCPLTSLEEWSRANAGMDSLPTTGFVDRYIAGHFYPSNRTGTAQALAFAAAALSWGALLWMRVGKRR